MSELTLEQALGLDPEANAARRVRAVDKLRMLRDSTDPGIVAARRSACFRERIQHWLDVADDCGGNRPLHEQALLLHMLELAVAGLELEPGAARDERVRRKARTGANAGAARRRREGRHRADGVLAAFAAWSGDARAFAAARAEALGMSERSIRRILAKRRNTDTT